MVDLHDDIHLDRKYYCQRNKQDNLAVTRRVRCIRYDVHVVLAGRRDYLSFRFVRGDCGRCTERSFYPSTFDFHPLFWLRVDFENPINISRVIRVVDTCCGRGTDAGVDNLPYRGRFVRNVQIKCPPVSSLMTAIQNLRNMRRNISTDQREKRLLRPNI